MIKKERQISNKSQFEQNVHPNQFSNILRLINQDVLGEIIQEESQWNQLDHSQIERRKIFNQYFKEHIQPRNQNQEQVQQIIQHEKNQSDTFVKEQQSNVKFMQSLQWFNFQVNMIKIFRLIQQKFDDSDLLIDKGYNTYIYSGLKLDDETPIAIKLTQINNDYFEYAQQFIIHQEISEHYPKMFLTLLLFLLALFRKTKFVSSLKWSWGKSIYLSIPKNIKLKMKNTN
ncbi:hypothetical protein pb186bvf_001767 [Paramecium bursaria]